MPWECGSLSGILLFVIASAALIVVLCVIPAFSMKYLTIDIHDEHMSSNDKNL